MQNQKTEDATLFAGNDTYAATVSPPLLLPFAETRAQFTEASPANLT